VKHCLLAAPKNRERHAHSHVLLGQEAMQVINARDGMIPITHDEIAFAHASSLCGAVVLNGDDQHAALNRQVMEAHQAAMERDILPGHADIAAPDLSVSYKEASDMLRHRHQYGEAETLGRENHGCINSYDFPARSHKGSARVAWVQCGVGLDDVIYQPARLGSERASKSADYPGGNCALEAIGISDGYYQPAHADGFRVAKLCACEIRGGDSNYGKVASRIFSYHLRLKKAAIGQGHLDPGCIMDDVAIGKDKAVRGKHEAGATERFLGKVRIGGLPASQPMANPYVDDRWAHALGRMDDSAGLRIQ